MISRHTSPPPSGVSLLLALQYPLLVFSFLSLIAHLRFAPTLNSHPGMWVHRKAHRFSRLYVRTDSAFAPALLPDLSLLSFYICEH